MLGQSYLSTISPRYVCIRLQALVAPIMLSLTAAILLVCIAELEVELQATQRTQYHWSALLPPVNSIPRPKGTTGDDYNLQEVMGLKNNPELYAHICMSTVMPHNECNTYS